MVAPAAGRPTPLREVARIYSYVVGGVGGVVASLVTAGVITAGQADTLAAGFTSVDLLLTALVGVITAGTAIAGAFGTAIGGQDKVTPNSDPAVVIQGHLVPLVPRPDPTTPTVPAMGGL